MVELLVVVTIILILVGSALVTMVPKVQSSRANAGMELVLGEMRRAHERAVDERRIYRVTFVPPNQIQLDIGQVANVASTITGTIPAFTQAQQTLTLPQPALAARQSPAAQPAGQAERAQRNRWYPHGFVMLFHDDGKTVHDQRRGLD